MCGMPRPVPVCGAMKTYIDCQDAIRSVSVGGKCDDTVGATCYDNVVSLCNYLTQSRPGLATSFRTGFPGDASTVLAIGQYTPDENHRAQMARVYTHVLHRSAWRSPVAAMVYSRARALGGGRENK